MSDDPQQIANYLVQEQGLKQAMQSALEGAAEAQRAGDNYSLSVWREVKTILREKTVPRD